MFNITSFLDNRAIESPEKQAIIHPSHSSGYTRRELYDTVCCISSGLRTRGVNQGDRVILYLDSSPEYLISILAIWRIGAVAVPTNIVYREEELTYAADDSGAVCIITDEIGRKTAGIVARKIGIPDLIIVGDTGPDSWETLKDSPPMRIPCQCRPDDVCQIQYTSGTTGRPKGAMLTHGGWMAAFDAEREALDLRREDVYWAFIPWVMLGSAGDWQCSGRVAPGSSWNGTTLMNIFVLPGSIRQPSLQECPR